MSATEILTIGSVIKHRGEYNAETTYYTNNQVTICNCVFQALGNNFSGIPPIEANSDGTINVVNTATWKCIVDNVKLYNAALTINGSDNIKYISIDEIDNLNIPQTSTGIYYVYKQKTERYTQIVGILFVQTDWGNHQVTQHFFSNYKMDKGNEMHVDNEATYYKRHYGVSSSQVTTGEWTAWENAITANVELKAILDELTASVSTVTDKIGQANGIAPLNEDGKIDSDYLPSSAKEVLAIGGLVENVTIAQTSVTTYADIVYDSDRNTFLARVNKGTELMPSYTYHNNWFGRENYCAEAEGEPYTEKIYTDGVSTYYYDGEALVCIGADNTEALSNLTASLNTEVSNRQSEDTKLKTDISNEAIERKKNDDTLRASIKAINGKFLNMTESEYAALSTYDDSTYYMLTEE